MWLAAGCDRPVAETRENLLAVPAVQPVTADSLLHDVLDVRLDETGRLWVLSASPPFIRLFDAEGMIRQVFGNHGGGPGELLSPRNFLSPTPEMPGIWIWDPGSRHVVRYSERGEYRGQTSLHVQTGLVLAGFTRWSFGEPVRPESVAGGFVIDVYGQVVRSRDLWGGRLLRLDSIGEISSDLVTFADLSGRTPTSGMDQVFDAVPLWSACPDGRIAVLNPDSSELRWYDARGAFDGRQDLAFSRPEVTEADIRHYVSLRVAVLASETDLDTAGPDTRRLIERTVADLLGQLPRIAPFTRLRCDGANRIWLQLFGTDPDPRGFGRSWIVVDGQSQRVVEFPSRFQPLHFGRRSAAGVLRDGFDVETPAVARYPSELVAGAKAGSGG